MRERRNRSRGRLVRVRLRKPVSPRRRRLAANRARPNMAREPRRRRRLRRIPPTRVAPIEIFRDPRAEKLVDVRKYPAVNARAVAQGDIDELKAMGQGVNV